MEILVTIIFGGFVVSSVGSLMVNNIRSAGKIENTQRSRENWNRASHFIDSEVAQSERIILNSALINLSQCSPQINANDFVFALEFTPNLKPAIYYVRDNEPNSKEAREGNSLWRCGPSFDLNGEYVESSSSPLEPQRLIDGLSETKSCTLTVNSSDSSEGKSLSYTLCLIQHEDQKYTQTATAFSRVNPFYAIPNENAICNPNLNVEGFEELSGTNSAESLGAGSNASIICGYGGGDTITGSSGNDIIEAGDSRVISGNPGGDDDEDDDNGVAPCGPGPPCTGRPSSRPACCFISDSDDDVDDDDDDGNGGGGTSGSEPAVLNGGDGSDRLLGGPGDDSLNGDDGDDVLIGQEGNDTLTGGTGNDQYLPGAGDNTIADQSGLDIVYIDQNQEEVNGLDNCTQSTCNLNYIVKGSSASFTATGVDLIIFSDSRFKTGD